MLRVNNIHDDFTNAQPNNFLFVVTWLIFNIIIDYQGIFNHIIYEWGIFNIIDEPIILKQPIWIPDKF